MGEVFVKGEYGIDTIFSRGGSYRLSGAVQPRGPPAPITPELAVPIIPVKSPDDPRLAPYRNIRDRERPGQRGVGGFIAETPLVVERMLSIPGLTRSLLLTPAWENRLGRSCGADTPIYVADGPLMESIVGFDIHRGVLGEGDRRLLDGRTLEAVLPPVDRPCTLLVCEDVNNIDNIGMLFRNAAAFGADAVLLSPRCHDPLYRKSLRVSAGHALSVPFVRATSWPGPLQDLATHRITCLGTSLDPTAAGIDDVPPPGRVAIVVGQEFTGLSGEAAERCDRLVRIPMAEGIDSLNVAVAAAVCLHRFTTATRGEGGA